MNILQCFEKLREDAAGNDNGHSYSHDRIDINEIWRTILSTEEELFSLAGLNPLLTSYGRDENKKYPAVVKAVKEFSDESVSPMERFKSGKSLVAFMSFFDDSSIKSIIRSFISVLSGLCTQAETLPLKSLQNLPLYGQFSVETFKYILKLVKSCKKDEKIAYALFFSMLFDQVTVCKNETEPTIEEFFDTYDSLIFELMKGSDIEKACACYAAATFAIEDEEFDRSAIDERLFLPSIELASSGNRRLAKEGHKFVMLMFESRQCIDDEHIYQFLGIADRYVYKNYYFKELRRLFASDDSIEEDDEDKLSNTANKKIVKFLNKIILNEKSKDYDVSEALGTLVEYGGDLNTIYSEKKLEIAERLSSKGIDEVNHGSLIRFLANYAEYPNQKVHEVVDRLISMYIEVAKKVTKKKLCGIIGESLEQIVLTSPFEKRREEVLVLIPILLKSNNIDNVTSAINMIEKMGDFLNESTIDPIYRSAIIAAESCDDYSVSTEVFKALKKIIRLFPVNEEISKEFVERIIKGDIPTMSNIPLSYSSEDNIQIYKYIEAFLMRFKSQAKAFSNTFFDILMSSVDDIKVCTLKPVAAILSHGAFGVDKMRKIVRICIAILEGLGTTYSTTLTEAVKALSYIRKFHPELVDKEKAVLPMSSVVNMFLHKDQEEEEEDIDDDDSDIVDEFKGLPYLTRIVLDILVHDGVDEDNDDELIDMICDIFDLMPFTGKNNLMDELCGMAAAFVEKNPMAELSGNFCKFMLSTVVRSQLCQQLNITEKTTKAMVFSIKNRCKIVEGSLDVLLEEVGNSHGLKRKIKNLLL